MPTYGAWEVGPYDWDAEADFPPIWKHPVDLIVEGETDPDAIRFATAAHLSELAVQTDGSAQALHAALRRLEESL